jgi:hypothetical protein
MEKAEKEKMAAVEKVHIFQVELAQLQAAETKAEKEVADAAEAELRAHTLHREATRLVQVHDHKAKKIKMQMVKAKGAYVKATQQLSSAAAEREQCTKAVPLAEKAHKAAVKVKENAEAAFKKAVSKHGDAVAENSEAFSHEKGCKEEVDRMVAAWKEVKWVFEDMQKEKLKAEHELHVMNRGDSRIGFNGTIDVPSEEDHPGQIRLEIWYEKIQKSKGDKQKKHKSRKMANKGTMDTRESSTVDTHEGVQLVNSKICGNSNTNTNERTKQTNEQTTAKVGSFKVRCSLTINRLDDSLPPPPLSHNPPSPPLPN